MSEYKRYKEVLGLVDHEAKGRYFPWWMFEISKKCLYQYKLLRDKPKDIKRKKKITIEMLFGSGIHYGMENLTGGKPVKVCEKLIRDEMLELGFKHISPQILSPLIKEAIHYFHVSRRLTKGLREGKGYAEASCRQLIPDKFIVLGCRVDHVEVVDEKEKVVDIWDYKGSSSEGSAKSAQLRYNATCVELAGWRVRHAFYVLPKIDLVKPIKWSEKLKERMVLGIINQLDKIDSQEDYAPSPNLWNCKYCFFGLSCPDSMLTIDVSDFAEGLLTI